VLNLDGPAEAEECRTVTGLVSFTRLAVRMLTEAAVPGRSAAHIVAIAPVSILIAVFQDPVVGGLTQGGAKG
jgi:hypothetical protein